MTLHDDYDPPDDAPLFAAAEREAALGIARSAQAAEDRDAGWRDAALEALRLYASFTPRFRAEEFVAKAPPSPTTDKAFGAILRAGAARGWIRKDGFEPSLGRHLSPAVVWRSNLCEASA